MTPQKNVPRSDRVTDASEPTPSGPVVPVAPPLTPPEVVRGITQRIESVVTHLRSDLNLALRDLREVHETLAQARLVVDRMDDSPAREELVAILEQRWAVIGECEDCGYPLFDKDETTCRFCYPAPTEEGEG